MSLIQIPGSAMLGIMGAIKDLWQSERGIVVICLIIASTVLCVQSAITTTQWLDYTKWLFLTYAAAKTVTGAVAMATNQPKPDSAPNPASTKTV